MENLAIVSLKMDAIGSITLKSVKVFQGAETSKNAQKGIQKNAEGILLPKMNADSRRTELIHTVRQIMKRKRTS